MISITGAGTIGIANGETDLDVKRLRSILETSPDDAEVVLQMPFGNDVFFEVSATALLPTTGDNLEINGKLIDKPIVILIPIHETFTVEQLNNMWERSEANH